jgi:hypothetical protein
LANVALGKSLACLGKIQLSSSNALHIWIIYMPVFDWRYADVKCFYVELGFFLPTDPAMTPFLLLPDMKKKLALLPVSRVVSPS